MIRIVAFDLSLACTGWCEGSNIGTLVPPKGHDRGLPRLDWIRARVMEKADSAQLVAIEGYSFASEASRAHSLGELGGLIKWNVWARKIPIVIIPPTSLKMFATGKGNAKKDEVFAAAIRKLGYVGNSHDEADARWLWTMAQAHYTAGPLELTEAQARSMEKIDWPVLSTRSDE